MAGIGDQFLIEMNRQPQAMRHTADQAERASEDVLREFRDHDATAVVFTGMGTSLSSGWAAASLLARNGTDAYSLPASELLYARWRGIPKNARVVAVSQSGESAETVRLCQLLHTERPDVRIFGVTNQLDSSLAESAHLTISTDTGEELAPSTMTFAATMAMHYALIQFHLNKDGDQRLLEFKRPIQRAAEQVEDMIHRRAQITEIMRQWHTVSQTMMAVGRGTALTAAQVGCLVYKEAARQPAEAMDSGEFRHGPIELAGPQLAIAIVSIEESTRDLDSILADELSEAGSSVISIGSVTHSEQHIPMNPVDPLLDTVTAAQPLILGAWQQSHARGLTPESMVFASKVTARE